jgi:hypothetical protein
VIELLNLALPYFGLIFLGFACGRWQKIPESGLAWMDFFILYVALPALFYRILAKTPLEQLNNAPFIVAATMATFLMLVISFAIAFLIRRDLARSDHRSACGRIWQYRLHGSRPSACNAWHSGGRAGSTDFLFRNAALLLIRTLPDGTSPSGRKAGRRAGNRSDAKNCASSAFDCDSSWCDLGPPAIRTSGSARPFNAIFEKRRSTLRAIHAWRNRCVAAIPPCAVGGSGSIGDQACASPADGFARAKRDGTLRTNMGGDSRANGCPSARPKRIVLARQYGTWVQPASGAVLLGTLFSVATVT